MERRNNDAAEKMSFYRNFGDNTVVVVGNNNLAEEVDMEPVEAFDDGERQLAAQRWIQRPRFSCPAQEVAWWACPFVIVTNHNGTSFIGANAVILTRILTRLTV